MRNAFDMNRICFFAFAWLSVTPFAALAQVSINSQVDQLIRESAAIDMFSGNVLIAAHGKVVFTGSAGFADWEQKLPFNDSVRFNIGSIGKDFTQVVVAQLAQEGKIDPDASLNSYLDLFPESISKKITIRMLLRHEAGLGDYHPAPVSDLQSRLEIIRQQPLRFEPGTDNSYSNSGYVVLAAIIEKVTGQSFDDNVMNRIFRPLGMKHSQFYYPEMKKMNMSKGTEVKPNGMKVTEHRVNDVFTPSGDGGQYSTTGDLLRFYESLLSDNQLLTNEYRLQFFSAFSKQPAFTLQQLLTDARTSMGYAGGLNGWNADVEIFPGLNYIVIALSNFSDSDRPAEELCRRIGQIVMGEPYDAPQIPRFRFAYLQLQAVGVEAFTRTANDILQQNGYQTIQGPFFYNQLGYALLSEQRTDEAIILFMKNTQLFPDDPNVYDSLGEAYLSAGDITQARIHYEKALKMDPQNEHASQVLKKLKG